MCPPLGPITGAGGWASMIGAVWVTCRPADTGVGTMGVVELEQTTHQVYVMTGRNFPKEGMPKVGRRKTGQSKFTGCHTSLHWSM